jgi:hypothetical protein
MSSPSTLLSEGYFSIELIPEDIEREQMVRSKKRTRTIGEDVSSAFDNVKDQLAYCGLWCGSCSVGNGTVNFQSRTCRKTLTDYGVNEWDPKGVDYSALLKGLEVLSSTDPCPGCLKGGGNKECPARACAMKKGISECYDCGSKKSCENARYIDHMRSGARGVGMLVKDSKGDRAKVLRDWISEHEGV